ncbi:phytoene desaturase family protein [Dyadobacter sandarakinus]|uniref:NAD(P)/FAD-dependent oxidoreductase n=1 Tax=Dyadobacter sandarakinus TaxID=2747268 RepID=A0ABX7I5H4_9BACT|nr:NAD(P)/FAD-dependent oxidoreductase [Dyadobacter sandarakinus]QRR01337.1 NAD(P)/FAD-dependent oxidoreductase [Dyadobacter sandarakinus]
MSDNQDPTYDFDNIIIGSGMGALSAAICLARAGQSVLILEQHDVPGGWCHSFYIDGHRFSPGCHYIGQLGEGQSTRMLYEGLGIAGELTFFEMNPAAYEHCWIGDQKIDLPASYDALYNILSQHFPEEQKGLKQYLTTVQQVSRQLGLISEMDGFLDHLTIPWRTRHLGKYGLFSLKKVVDWHIRSPLLKRILNIQWGNHGLPPAQASFPYHAAVMDHYSNGGFYPMGGGAAIVKAMTNVIKKHGGHIRTRQKVRRILIGGEKTKRAEGVELTSGECIYAKRVISNADPETTYLHLVGQEYLSARLLKQIKKTRYSCTSLILFLTVDMDVRKAGLDSGNIWVMPDMQGREMYEQASNVQATAEQEFPGLFVSCSTLKDPTSYDGTHHTLEVITLIDHQSFSRFKDEKNEHSPAYLQYKEELCEKMITGLERVLPGISKSIVQKELGTPLTNMRYIGSTNGCIYGTEKSFWQIGAFGYKAESEIENLYLCGASILANGVAGASYSGVQTAARILGSTQAMLLKTDAPGKLNVYQADDTSAYPEWLKTKMKTRQKLKV